MAVLRDEDTLQALWRIWFALELDSKKNGKVTNAHKLELKTKLRINFMGSWETTSDLCSNA
jgi:hypothetical protein